MGIYDFNILTENDRYDRVFTEGQFIDTVSEGDIKYALYSLSYFWVEIEYDSPSNKIIGISSFVARDTLNRYSNVPNKFSMVTKKKKFPRWIRIISYNFNCIWYHVLMPVGMPEDDFSKQTKSK